jgi:glycogen debranching enzyme
VTEAAVRLGTSCAWRGTTLLVTDTAGECGPDDALSGLYVREVRHLRTLRFEINGRRPWLCEWARPRADQLAYVFVYPELVTFGGGGSGLAGDAVTRDEDGIPHRALDVRLRYEVDLHRLVVRAVVANRSMFPVSCEASWTFEPDYADLLEASEPKRQQEAPVQIDVDGGVVVCRYAHDRLPFRTLVRGTGPSTVRVEPGRWAAALELASGAEAMVELTVEAEDPDLPMDEAARSARHRRHEEWKASVAHIAVPGNPSLEQILTRCADDLASFPLLEGQPDEWLALQAGVPLYPAFFGRDALTAGWQAGLLDGGAMLDAAMTRLGRLQSTRDDAWRDEEPGRIPQQVRSGPLARLGVNPYSAYYADFASPLMFVISLGNLYAWTGDRGLLDRHWDVARRILDWARTRGDRDGDGYLEYLTRSPMGAKNQGWKDSGDAIVYADGRSVPAPIATCELQAYWFCAQQIMAILSWVRGDRKGARELWRSARELKRRFNRDFWLEGEGFFGLALDPEKRLVDVVTSNVGQCLAAGIIERERLPRVVQRLFEPDLFSGWGIRTLSARHPAYNPLGYHLGSVWAVENATICFGLRRFGFDVEAGRLAEALFRLAALYTGNRIPETVGGYSTDDHPTPGAYPRSNTPQTWNASALPLCVHTLLGLLPYAAWHVLVVDPVLPEWLPSLDLVGLRVGGTRASLRFWRDVHGRSHAEVTEKDGPLHLVRQPPVEALGIGLGRRLRAAVGRTHGPRSPLAAR